MNKKKYNRPFVEVLMLETSGGMMNTTSPDKGKAWKSRRSPFYEASWAE